MKDGLLDWDSPKSLAIEDMAEALKHIQSDGSFPVSLRRKFSHRSGHGVPASDMTPGTSLTTPAQPTVNSKEDQNSVGPSPVSEGKVAEMKAKVQEWLEPGSPGHAILGGTGLRLCLLDGFLLYCAEMEAVMKVIDIKLFLLVSRAKATHRREARDGYVTLEGFWKDPPGYVDKIVWPNYVEAHRWLFENGDVESQLDENTIAKTGIKAQTGKGLDVDLDTTLEWSVNTIIAELEKEFS